MSNYATLKSAIQSAVYTNGNGEITGAGLQAVLLQIVNTVGDGYVFKGVATAGTSAGTPDTNVFYIAPAGTYTNFGSSYTVAVGEVGVFSWNGSWSKSKVSIVEFVDSAESFDTDKALAANQGRKAVLRVSALNKSTSKIVFQNVGHYLDYAGGMRFNPLNENIGTTDYIPVLQGDTFLYDLYFVTSGSGLSYCWGYDEDYQPVEEIVPFLTGGKIGKFTVTNVSVKYIRAFSVIADHYLLYENAMEKRLEDELQQSIGTLTTEIFMQRMVNAGTFIREDGRIASGSESAGTTEFIAVENGQTFEYDFGFVTSGTQLSYCWGYDEEYTAVEELVPFVSATSTRGTFTITNASVRYIRAFSKLGENHYVSLQDSIEMKIDKMGGVTWNYITVGSSDNAIRTAMAGITDASEFNRYVIIVPDGNHFECDIKGKKYVKIKGQSRKGTIIYCDGTSNKLTPADYTYTDYRGVALSTVPRSQKHIMYLDADLDIENVTLRAISCKYTIHFEDNGWQDARISNCIIEGNDVLALLGYGLRGSQTCVVDGCVFRGYNSDEPNALYIHNWYWERTTALGIPLYGGGALVKMKDCLFECEGSYLLRIGEIASMNDDRVVFDGCDISGATKVINWMVEMDSGVPYARDLDGDPISDPLAVPYCIQLLLFKVYSGGDAISYTQADRPNYTDMVTQVI